MDDHEVARRITSLEARMSRIERLLQQLLLTMTSSHAHIEQTQQLQGLLQELRNGQDIYTQERPEIAAIRQALLAGNKLQAIKIYRNLYGVSLQEAKNAIERM
jgi:ribosomal protein L7/L12